MEKNEEKTECCKEKSECCKDYCEMSGKMLCMSNQAWECLMKEKMKKVWEKARGPTMDKVAEVAVNHCMDVWKAKMASEDMSGKPSKEQIEKYKEDLGNAFKG